ncbi:uncharacterized protein TA06985 [Theileria annulata]|uniref:Uncharacterized protein n=1 Tax=Theileria annulata TaxID=5874 RepID=Q4UHW8_THEAN|nr:uncharacterized protein TA06985 [Theileria annulata]CAI73321.1 hypothetical protein, conserved [Theileria annulata]|eukprot:XP_953998.1 hypothetical protein, conserved [Theileria annulata]
MILRRQIPPWEISSRNTYRKWKNNKTNGHFKLFLNSFKSFNNCVNTTQITAISEKNCINELKRGISVNLEEVCIRLQQLSNPVNFGKKNINQLLTQLINKVDEVISYISVDSLFKFLVSYSKVVNSLVYINNDSHILVKNGLKISNIGLFKKLFNVLQTEKFEINRHNIIQLIDSYVRLCVGYSQDSETFCNIYKRSVNLIVSGKIKISQPDFDKLLLLFDRMGLYDRAFIEFYSRVLCKYFDNFTQDQFGNFCRYLSKLPYVQKKPIITHINTLSSNNGMNSSNNVDGFKCVKKLPYSYVIRLLNRRNYDYKVKIDYSTSISTDREREVLKDWDFRNSKFVKFLDKKLPYCLHQFTYYNLIDVAEMYYVYGIKSEILPRFASEIWKYLYTLKYGYTIKALIVLGNLGLGDGLTYGRLIRNIPSSLAFNWPPELIAEALITCGSLNIQMFNYSGIYIADLSLYNKLSQYLERRVMYFKDPKLICRIFEALSIAKVPQYGLYYQLLTLLESFPNWLHLKHIIQISKSTMLVGMFEKRLFRVLISKLDEVKECSVSEIVPIIVLSKEIVMDSEDSKNFYAFILRYISGINGSVELELDELMDLLNGLVTIQVKTKEIEQIILKTIGNNNKRVGRLETHHLLRLIEYMSILGKVESKELLSVITGFVSEDLQKFNESEVSTLIWDLIAIGVELNDETLLKVVKRFNQLRPMNNKTHLLTVVSMLVRMSEMNDKVWKDFLKIVEGYKDFSWSKSQENINIIKSVANTIKDSETFVKQFPYTIDITALYSNIDSINIPKAIKPLNNYEKEENLITKSNDCRNDMALFYYNSDENPFILHLNPDGTHEHYFNFYCQTRKKILQNLGWKDTLIFTPNK